MTATTLPKQKKTSDVPRAKKADAPRRIARGKALSGESAPRVSVPSTDVAEMNRLWSKICEMLTRAAAKGQGDVRWLEDACPLALGHDTFTVGVATLFLKRLLTAQGVLARLKECAQQIVGRNLSVTFTVDGALYQALHRKAAEILAPVVSDSECGVPTARGESAEVVADRSLLVAFPRENAVSAPSVASYFEGFVVSPENQLALSAARKAAETPGEYPLIVLHGRSGVGKTHLLRSTYEAFVNSFPHKRAMYVSLRDWSEEFSNAFVSRTLDEFREKYRRSDFLAMDDVQLLAEGDKKATKEEFTALLDALTRERKQLIAASDRPPAEWKGVPEKTRGRLMAALTVGLDMPVGSAREELAVRKALEAGIVLPPEEARVLARGVSDIRSLEGAMLRLKALVQLQGCQVCVSSVGLALRTGACVRESVGVRIEDIAKATATVFGVRVSDIKGKSRKKGICTARTVVGGLARRLTGSSLADIGSYLGSRTHSTVSSMVSGAPEKLVRAGVMHLIDETLMVLGSALRFSDVFPTQGELF